MDDKYDVTGATLLAVEADNMEVLQKLDNDLIILAQDAFYTSISYMGLNIIPALKNYPTVRSRVLLLVMFKISTSTKNWSNYY